MALVPRVAEEKKSWLADRPRLDIVFFTEGLNFDGNTIFEKALGGSETAAFYLCREFARAGHRVRVFCNTDKPGDYDGVEYHKVEEILDFDEYPDVLIVSRQLEVLQFPKLDAKLVILWMHDILAGEWVQKLMNVLWKIDLIVVNSSWAKDQANDKYALNKVPERTFFVARNGVDWKLAKVESEKEERDRYRVMYTSRPERGLDVLLEMWPRLKAGIPQASLYITAYDNPLLVHDPRQQEIENGIKAQLTKLEEAGNMDVHLLPPLSKPELYRELGKSRLVLYPSTFPETSCISALEAMACGAPMVAADFAALGETIRHRATGWLIPGLPKVPRSESFDLGCWFNEPHTMFQADFIAATARLMRSDVEWDRLRIGGMMQVQWHDYKLIAGEWEAKMYETLDRTNHSQTVTACIILRDDQDDLYRCLNSILPQVDGIRLLVDTRSKDRTLTLCNQYAKKHSADLVYGIVVAPLKWEEDSFSWARNKSIEGVPTDWILWIDGDEVLDNNLRQYLRSNSFNSYGVGQWHLTPGDQRIDMPARLFRATLGVQFQGSIHEQPELILNQGVPKAWALPDARILHYGYSKGGALTIEERWNRNHTYLERDIQANPNRDITWYNYMRDGVYFAKYVMEKQGALTDDALTVLTQVTDVCWKRFLASDHIWHDEASKLYQMALTLLGYPDFAIAIAGSKIPLPGDYTPGAFRLRFRAADEIMQFVAELVDRTTKQLYPPPLFRHKAG